MSLPAEKKLRLLSDTELLDAVELLMRRPEFLDLYLGFDRGSQEYFAGFESGKTLRDVLCRVLAQNAREDTAAQALIPSAAECATNGAHHLPVV